MRRFVKSAAGVVAVTLGLGIAACSGGKAKTDDAPTEDQAKMHNPPDGAEGDVKMPQGPPVVRQRDGATAEDGARSGEEGEVATGAEATEGAATVTRAQVDAFMDKGPPYIFTIVTVEPVHQDGFQGFQIVEVTREAREFMMPQMRVGDVVTHVNGVRILKPGDHIQAWRSLDKVSTIRVDFKRKNEPLQATWVVK